MTDELRAVRALRRDLALPEEARQAIERRLAAEIAQERSVGPVPEVPGPPQPQGSPSPEGIDGDADLRVAPGGPPARPITWRRGVAVAAAALVAVLVGVGVVWWLAPSGTDEVAEPPSVTEAPQEPSDASGGNPALAPLFGLPACPDAGDLAAWVTGAVASYRDLSDASFEEADLGEVVELTPVVRAPDGGACVVAGFLGEAAAWELRDGAGEVLGRGVSIPHGRTVPEHLIEEGGENLTYHQEHLGSGQSFTGVVDGGRVEGISNSRLVVLSIDERLVPSPDPYAFTESEGRYEAGALLLSRLSLGSLAAVPAEDRLLLPAEPPSGWERCGGPYLLPPALGAGDGYLFCNSRGQEVELRLGSPAVFEGHEEPPREVVVPPGADEGDPIEVAGVTGRTWVRARARSVEVVVAHPGIRITEEVAIRVTGPEELGAEPLVELLEAIPAVNPEVMEALGLDTGTVPSGPEARFREDVGIADLPTCYEEGLVERWFEVEEDQVRGDLVRTSGNVEVGDSLIPDLLASRLDAIPVPEGATCYLLEFRSLGEGGQERIMLVGRFGAPDDPEIVRFLLALGPPEMQAGPSEAMVPLEGLEGYWVPRVQGDGWYEVRFFGADGDQAVEFAAFARSFDLALQTVVALSEPEG